MEWTPLAEINEADISAKRFEYNELRTATRNFAEDMKLGAGAYGAVYKVRLSTTSTSVIICSLVQSLWCNDLAEGI